MDKIIRHIETLLRRHDYVILPDFGGFVTQRQSAKINTEQIEPPLAVVGFNPLMNISDGMLAIEISRAENKSFREAIQQIESEIVRLKQKLNNGEQVSCGNLGALYLDGQDKVMFVPSTRLGFLPVNYGLNTLYYSKIACQAVEKETKKTVTITIPRRSKIARYAAVAIIAAGLMFAPVVNDTRNTTASLNPAKFFDFSEQTLIPDTSNVEHHTALQIHTETTSLQQATEQQQEEVKKYHVVVSCMPTRKMADELCEYLKENNYTDAFVLLPSIKTYRVVIQSFTNKEVAILYMENLRRTNAQFSDAWVLTK